MLYSIGQSISSKSDLGKHITLVVHISVLDVPTILSEGFSVGIVMRKVGFSDSSV